MPDKDRTDFERPKLRPIIWLGDSRKNIQTFPAGARKILGEQLTAMQYGFTPKDAKPFHGIGPAVVEIAVRYDKNAYRTVAALSLGKKIYILHAFQKKAKSGVSTPKADVDLIKRRYQFAREVAADEQE